jgi:hypothetical protein
MNRQTVVALISLWAGLITFLVVGYGKRDVGDEFLYGLAVAALFWLVLSKTLKSTNRRP